jgi:hypothetical protein
VNGSLHVLQDINLGFCTLRAPLNASKMLTLVSILLVLSCKTSRTLILFSKPLMAVSMFFVEIMLFTRISMLLRVSFMFGGHCEGSRICSLPSCTRVELGFLPGVWCWRNEEVEGHNMEVGLQERKQMGFNGRISLHPRLLS